MKSLSANAVKITPPPLRPGAFSIRPEGSAMAKAAPDIHDTFEILAQWFMQSYNEPADNQS